MTLATLDAKITRVERVLEEARAELILLREERKKYIGGQHPIVYVVKLKEYWVAQQRHGWSTCGVFTTKERADEQVEKYKSWGQLKVKPAFSTEVDLIILDKEICKPDHDYGY